MSKIEDRYNVASGEYIEAKASGDPAAYKKAKTKLAKAKAAWRAERDTAYQGNGAVRPAPIRTRSAVNNGS